MEKVRFIQSVLDNLGIKIRERIHEFFHPSIESIIKKFAIVEDTTITQEEAEELLKILEEWKEKRKEHNYE